MLLAGCFAKPDLNVPKSADSYDGPHKTRDMVVDSKAAAQPSATARPAAQPGGAYGSRW